MLATSSGPSRSRRNESAQPGHQECHGRSTDHSSRSKTGHGAPKSRRGIPIPNETYLDRRTMTDGECAGLPPFAFDPRQRRERIPFNGRCRRTRVTRLWSNQPTYIVDERSSPHAFHQAACETVSAPRTDGDRRPRTRESGEIRVGEGDSRWVENVEGEREGTHGGFIQREPSRAGELDLDRDQKKGPRSDRIALARCR